MSRRLVLVGGSAGTGKTTAASTLASRLGASWLQLDALWIAMRDATPAGSSSRSVLDVDAHLRADAEPVDTLVERHVAASEAVCAVLTAALGFELQAHASVVADGAWVLPGWAAELRLDDTEVLPVFLHEPDPARLAAAMASRRAGPPAGWHTTSDAVAHAYGTWLVGRAGARHLPVVEARPYATTVDRLVEALDLTAAG